MQRGYVPRACSCQIQTTNQNVRFHSSSTCKETSWERELGERAWSEALRVDSARLRYARESPTNFKGCSLLFEVRRVYFTCTERGSSRKLYRLARRCSRKLIV
jgi:hypothetical protein